MAIERVAVLGAGVMGSGIAAQIANAGLPVILLDIASSGVAPRDELAKNAIARMQKAHPAPFMHADAVRRIETGSIEHDLDRIAQADWIIEAVVEQIAIKRDLYRRIDAVRKPDAVVSSNTSTIPLAQLTKGLSSGLCAHFLITHFFNPPRYMRLLEVVSSAVVDATVVAAICDCADRVLGKGIVQCKDTPGFIGNRIGIFWLQCALTEALRLGLRAEQADAIMGAPIGIPRTGVFGLLDLIGIDLMPHVIQSMNNSLPPNDPMRRYCEVPPLVQKMIARGYTGRKGKGGFYRLQSRGKQRLKQVIDLHSGDYRELLPPQLACLDATGSGDLAALVDCDDLGGRYATEVLTATLHYAASLSATIADDIVAVDEAMRLGYNWKYGPFELIDKLGCDWLIARCQERSLNVPDSLRQASGGYHRVHNGERQFLDAGGHYRSLQRPRGVLRLADLKYQAPPVISNDSVRLWDSGDGVACLEFHSKMNVIDLSVLDFIQLAIDRVHSEYRALVIHNEGEHFSAGANLKAVLAAIESADWAGIEAIVEQGQQAYKALRYARFPVVGAPSGMALGGGCELLLHCDAISAHAETYCGLVEVRAGLIPAWGGCVSMLARCSAADDVAAGPMPPLFKAFTTIATATVSGSAAQARDSGFLRADDVIIMNRDRILADAKTRAIALSSGYCAPDPRTLLLPGRSGKAALDMLIQSYKLQGKITAYDGVIADQLADVLSGFDADLTTTVHEDKIYALERAAFATLIRRPETHARIQHLLSTGKPLRN